MSDADSTMLRASEPRVGDALPADARDGDAGRRRRPTRTGSYLELMKPRLTLLSLLTTLAGYYMASSQGLDAWKLVHTLLGTFMVGGGCGALNMYIERHHDAKMRRTMTRPLPTGMLAPAEALLFGLGLSIAGTVYLLLAVNALAAALALATIVSYVLFYTPLKRVSTLNTVVGAIPGALPPLIGWCAASGSFAPEGWALFAILFFWQMPHFLALAWMYRNDYERGGYRILTVVDRTGAATARQILLYTAALLPVSLIPAALRMTDTLYFYGALALGLGFLALAFQQALTRKNKHAKHLFYYSLLYLPLLLLLMAIDRGL